MIDPDKLAGARFQKGEFVFKEGDAADGRMFFILSGELSVSKKIQGRVEKIRDLGERQFFGEIALVNQGPRTASVHVVSDLAKLAIIDRIGFALIGKKNPLFLFNLLRILAKRVMAAEERVAAKSVEPLQNEPMIPKIDIFKYIGNLYTISHRNGDVIYKEKERVQNMYLVQTGSVSTYKLSNGSQVELQKLGESSLFGETGMLAAEKTTHSAVVQSNFAKIGVIDNETFLRIGRGQPEFFYQMLKTMIERLLYFEGHF